MLQTAIIERSKESQWRKFAPSPANEQCLGAATFSKQLTVGSLARLSPACVLAARHLIEMHVIARAGKWRMITTSSEMVPVSLRCIEHMG